ncbi:MAG: polysaccharide biosynthesis/export family protein [Nitrospirae bacterium]|nr:polysaccharide biosynthesis/export family protein [Candidatus Manganitrophaceae bacterium]
MKKGIGWLTLWGIFFQASILFGVDGKGIEPGYLLGPEDVLHVSIWKDEALTREVLVRPDGRISFPLVGDLQAAGRTVEDLKAELTKRLTPFIPNPTLSVEVQKVNSYKIYVLGKVARPGEYLVGHETDVMQALSLAGGLTPYAAENRIRVLRRENGAQQTYLFRYSEAIQGEHLEQNILLRRGDVVVVP